MGNEEGVGVDRARTTEPSTERTLQVALGRRVEIIGDLLLPTEPTDCSRAACRDIGRRLEEWQGPGIVVLCGRLVAPSCPAGAGSAGALGRHPELTDALSSFAARDDSQVVVVMAAAERDGELVQALERCQVTVRDAVDLACETGAGVRTVLVRAGSMRPDANPPFDPGPTEEERPWLAGIERLDDQRLARRFVTSRLLYRRLRRYLWAPPLLLAAIALLLRVDFVIDGLGRIFRSPPQQSALQRAYAATWFSRFIVTVVIAIALLAVLAMIVAVTSRGIWRALGGEGLPAPWAGGASGTRPVAHAQLELDGEDALDATARGHRGRGLGGRRGWGDCPGAHASRRGVLCLSGRHRRGRPRTPRSTRAPADFFAPPSGSDPRD